MTQHGATLRLADPHWFENDYYQFGRYINVTGREHGAVAPPTTSGQRSAGPCATPARRGRAETRTTEARSRVGRPSGGAPHRAERIRRAAQVRGQAIDRFRRRRRLLRELLPLALLDRFAHARQRLHAVAGVEARRVDLMREPRPPRQAFRAGQRALGLHQQRARRLTHLVRHRPARDQLPLRLVVGARLLLQPIERVLQIGEVEERHRFLRRGRRRTFPFGSATAFSVPSLIRRFVSAV